MTQYGTTAVPASSRFYMPAGGRGGLIRLRMWQMSTLAVALNGEIYVHQILFVEFAVLSASTEAQTYF